MQFPTDTGTCIEARFLESYLVTLDSGITQLEGELLIGHNGQACVGTSDGAHDGENYVFLSSGHGYDIVVSENAFFSERDTVLARGTLSELAPGEAKIVPVFAFVPADLEATDQFVGVLVKSEEAAR